MAGQLQTGCLLRRLTRPPCPCCRPAVVTRLPGLQNLLLSHNRLGGSLSCDLMGPALAELDLAGGLGGWVRRRWSVSGAWGTALAVAL
jgi:hypothetical protein